MLEVDPEAQKAVSGLSQHVRNGGLDEGLHALVDIRASQINHCAWCLDVHVAQARNADVEQR
jgi:AhpD family alkylhydroperoxidase